MKNDNYISLDANDDGIDRAGFLKCMGWAGTGLFCIMSGGVRKSYGMSQLIDKGSDLLNKAFIITTGAFRFVQSSDSHIVLTNPANTDVSHTLMAASRKIK